MIAKLFRNGLRFRLLKYRGKPHRLEAMSVEITHRCLCRCRMCNIWKIPADVPDLELRGLAGAVLLARTAQPQGTGPDRGGAFPAARPGRPPPGHLRSSAGLLSRGCARVSITTNGLLTERILAVDREIIGPLQQQGIDLVLACGMDAADDLHDRIQEFPRGVEAARGNAGPVCAGSGQSTSNLVLGIKTTVVPLNAYELERIADYAEKHDLFTIISPLHHHPQPVRQPRPGGGAAVQSGRAPGDAALFRKRALCLERPSGGAGALFPQRQDEKALLRRLQYPVHPPQRRGFCLSRHCRLAGQYPATRPWAACSGARRPTGSGKRSAPFPSAAVCTEPGMERIAWPLEGFALLRTRFGRGWASSAAWSGTWGWTSF